MRVINLLLFIGLLAFAGPALAQADLSLYRVENVTSVMTAPSAATARDEAIVEAQHQALTELVARLGAEGAAEGVTDESLGALVQAFEVQKEHASPGRYVGTFTVQFRPSAVRALLDKRGMDYTEAQSSPIVVLPVFISGGREILWEERTPWLEAWEEVSKKTGLVPLAVPSGELSDIALISTREALDGDVGRLQAVIRKYQAGGVVVVVLRAEPDDSGAILGGEIRAKRYDLGGQAYDPFELTLTRSEEEAGTAGSKPLEMAAVLGEGAKRVIAQLEKEWKEKTRDTIVTGPALVMSVNVPVPTLAAWAQIKERLTQVQSVIRANVATMARGLVHIELAFHGDLPSLQEDLAEQNLELVEYQPGRWELRERTAATSFF
jgi:hypothetical protein